MSHILYDFLLVQIINNFLLQLIRSLDKFVSYYCLPRAIHAHVSVIFGMLRGTPRLSALLREHLFRSGPRLRLLVFRKNAVEHLQRALHLITGAAKKISFI